MKIQEVRIDSAKFSEFLQKMPQVSVELFVERDEKVLVAQRRNAPAQGEWFVPGSRLYKGETFEHAVNRIAGEELSIDVEIIGQLGAYNHFWDSGAFPSVDKTHTVNIVYRVQTQSNDEIQLDSQHEDWCYTDGTDLDLHRYVEEYIEDYRRHCLVED